MTDADALARRCADAMWAGDAASRGLGMVLDRVEPGSARLSMPFAPPSSDNALAKIVCKPPSV